MNTSGISANNSAWSIVKMHGRHVAMLPIIEK